MKGVVFTEFLDMVEDKFGYEVVDEIIESSDLPHNGAYTSIGTYPHEEIVTLVVNLSKTTKIDVPTLLHTFGFHLFGQFSKGYPSFFEKTTDAFNFLESIEDYIHVEVKKLYPDAELPRFKCKRLGNNVLEMIYHSDRSMSDLALGLIDGCAKHFNEKIEVDREDISEGDGKVVKFIIKKV